jgi:hypothetical protein
MLSRGETRWHPFPNAQSVCDSNAHGLALSDGVLTRRFEEADAKRSHWQLILPRSMRSEFISSVHARVAGAISAVIGPNLQ